MPVPRQTCESAPELRGCTAAAGEGALEQSGEYRIPASRERVWEALNDPEILAACIDGCQSLTRVAEDRFEGVVRARIGPVSATFRGNVALVDLKPPESYGLQVEAKGGAAGFGKGEATVTLDATPEGTLLRYGARANVGGKLAQIGSRLVDGAVRKMADSFFAAFTERLGGSTDTQGGDLAATEAAAAVPGAVEPPVDWRLAAGVLLIVVIVAIFSAAG